MVDPDRTTPIPHGGNLTEAAARYGIPRATWLDLSTGINPVGYPVPSIDAQAWLRLPDDDDDLEAVAAHHYGAPRALAVAGTQAAIRMLPSVLPRGRVGIALLTYGEYAPAFGYAGYPVSRFVTPQFGDLAHEAAFVLNPGQPLPDDLLHLVLVNPNNPGAERWSTQIIMDWAAQLAARGGTLIVDEAFVEAMPTLSVAQYVGNDALIVLRSVGKFYGLAGARVGFVLAGARVDRALRTMRGPWSVSGPSRIVTRAALCDAAWQCDARARLEHEGARLAALLGTSFMSVSHTPLFAWVREDTARDWQHGLARRGIWIRRFEQVDGLRFGLPRDEAQWMRLEGALSAVRQEIEAGRGASSAS
ncbi:threonine-phosphate decarboxylase CobD [Pararobbsia silviterrae]|uniref:threonine-phosphate decarboxylase n=1 Tax=Pararobbsia silviterrae TaxID=1792498 RepID=A0A494XRP7_9BURK|nr:threonine-phosphate decarboxylase CobD [Pararobbsia silviterrae]RKP53310.1 threonine-phosphate decarboxylase [Pararobbsia silviterrae]